MTDEQARDLFSAALDGELDGAAQADFDAHLRAHPALAQEYERFRRTLNQVAELHQRAAVPDLLPGVQKKLRQRGRHGLGDGTAHLRGRGWLTPLSLGLVGIGLLLVLWLAMRLMTEL